MGPPSYMRSVVDRNVVIRRIPVVASLSPQKPGSNSMWDLWCAKWHWKNFMKYLFFLLLVIIPPLSRANSFRHCPVPIHSATVPCQFIPPLSRANSFRHCPVPIHSATVPCQFMHLCLKLQKI